MYRDENIRSEFRSVRARLERAGAQIRNERSWKAYRGRSVKHLRAVRRTESNRLRRKTQCHGGGTHLHIPVSASNDVVRGRGKGWSCWNNELNLFPPMV